MTMSVFEWICLKPTECLWDTESTPEELLQRQRLAEEVSHAVDKLPESERLIIRRHYFEGLTYAEVGRELGLLAWRVKAISRRARRQLRKLLAAVALEQFHIRLPQVDCPICRSQSRVEAEAVIASQRAGESFAPVIQLLKREFAIVVKSPNTIIGHSKYHC